MTISYPLALPSSTASSRVVLRARELVGSTRSPFTGGVGTYQWGGQWFEADVELPPLLRDDAEVWIAFLLSLKGMHGSFAMGDPLGTSPRGAGGGSPLVAGAGQTGSSLNGDGGPLSQTGWLKAGDWIQLSSGASSRLHKVLADANTDGAGAFTLDLWPDLRESPDDNGAIVLDSAKGRWMLASNTREWSLEIAQLYGLKFSAVEDLRPL